MTYLNSVLEHFDLAKRYRSYQLSLIKKFIGKKILEVGPGRGKIIDDFVEDSDKEIVLSEIDSEMCKILDKKFSKNSNVKIVRSNIENIDQKFDTVLYMDVIEHIKDHEKEILNAYSKLEKNGHLIFIVPAFQSLFSEFDSLVGHYRRYEKKFFEDFAKEREIKCVELKYFDSLGFLILKIKKYLKSKNNNVDITSVTVGVKIWNFLMPLSRILDKILINSLGKSLFCVYQKN